MEYKLIERQCAGCSHCFRVLETSPHVWCSRDCEFINTGTFNSAQSTAHLKRDAIMVEHRGQTRSLSEWSRILSVDYQILYDRFKNHGKF